MKNDDLLTPPHLIYFSLQTFIIGSHELFNLRLKPKVHLMRQKNLSFLVSTFCYILHNGYSPANLANSSTRQKFAIFGEFEYSPKWSF